MRGVARRVMFGQLINRGTIMKIAVRWAALFLLSFTLFGCQSPGVRSETGKKSEGVSYYLPKRLIKVTYTRAFPATTAAKRFNKALQAQADADKAAGATKAAMEEAEARRLAADPASPAYPQIEKEAAYQVVLHRIAVAAQTAANGELASATSDLERERSAEAGACGLVEKLEFATTAPTADRETRFIADVQHSIWRRDQVTLQTNKEGLLTSSNATLTDQTSEILVAFASSLVAGRTPLKMSASQRMDAPPDAAECKSASFELTVSPDELALVDSALKAAKSPLRLSLAGGGKQKFTSSNRAAKGGLYYRRDQTHLMRVYQSQANGAPDCSVGAPPEGAVIIPKCPLVASVPLLLPNYSPVERIAIDATTFATNVHALTFENGMLTQAQTDQPSELLAIVKLPTNIISGVLGSVTNLIQLRFNVGQQETALANQERALLCALDRLTAVRNDADPELPATLCP